MTARILFLAPDMFGPPSGIGRYCKLVAQALLAAGHQVFAVVLADSAHALPEPLVGLDYRPCHGARNEFVATAVAAMRQVRPHIVLIGHVHFAPLGMPLSAVAQARTATFAYGIDVMARLSPWRRWALRRSHAIIAISRFTAHQAVRHNGVDPARIRILHNCLDPSVLPVPFIGSPPASPSLLTVGRISLAEQYKGHDYVLRALPELLRRHPDLTYHIAGDGDGRSKLEALAAELGVAHAVRCHGFVSDQELQDLYASATLYIMPSRAEGFGFVFLEAMANGLPVIGGNQDATPEVIVDGVTGFLVNPTSVKEIIARTSTLLGDPDLCTRMGLAGIQHVKDRFGFPRFQAELLQYIGELT